MNKLFTLQMFGENDHPNFANFANSHVNVTTDNTKTTPEQRGNDLSPTMKEFYDTELLENARADLYFNQFGQKQALPKNHGNTVEWRRWETFAKAMNPLEEGVTPTGNKLSMVKINKEIEQFGDYSIISDRLELEALDNVILGATEEHGAQAGETLDCVTRNELLLGTNVMYANATASSNGGRSTMTAANILTPTLINKAATMLKKMHAPKIDGSYVAIIHPSVSEDLRESDKWIDVHKYAATEEIFNGEIGKLHGVRFVETTEQKIWKAGASGAGVYATMVFGKDAWGVIEPTAESLEMIIKQVGQLGGDPLNQRGSIGWKASHAAKILYEERLVRIESGSAYSGIDEAN